MSCLSRLFGLLCAVLPGLLFLAFSVLFFQRSPQLGFVTGPLYALASFVTGAVCLYLGVSILFGRDHVEDPAALVNAASETTALSAPIVMESVNETTPLQAAPLPTEIAAPLMLEKSMPAQSVSIPNENAPDAAPAPLDSPETRIRFLARSRPANWQVTAPQLAHLTNLNMAIADATAREMAGEGQAQIQLGPNGETVYIFNLADEAA